MGKLKTVNIKGKEYVEVNERLIFFRKTYPNFSLNLCKNTSKYPLDNDL